MTRRLRAARGRAGRSRLAAAAALLLCVALAGAPGSASGHGVDSDIRFRTDGLQPGLPGFALEIAPTGGRVTATNRSAETVVVLDDAGDPLYRLRPDRVVERRSATGWAVVARAGSITWHDHRTGPPASGRLPAVGRIPVLAGARRAVLEGTVVRTVPAASASPWWVLSVLPLLGLTGLARIVIDRSHRA